MVEQIAAVAADCLREKSFASRSCSRRSTARELLRAPLRLTIFWRSCASPAGIRATSSLRPAFDEAVRTIDGLCKPGMVLEGVVTNVTKFGAFVDIGVHQDGLVHISELSNRFIKDPAEAVKSGQIVKVKVLSVDTKAKRIGLSIKALSAPASRTAPKKQTQPPPATLNDKLAALSSKWRTRA